ncbi:hypothetical protein BpHYR1_026033 [Brachionus plicatilis]|uniref:Uncharacterized protein n=1 Tax=Brachionus plicatilis TaxID=10195 RepID=A0A3M7SYG9_BRAPC|nr:hypothetical protein BpHYR1_026033 [Brachionus plicatilis]
MPLNFFKHLSKISFLDRFVAGKFALGLADRSITGYQNRLRSITEVFENNVLLNILLEILNDFQISNKFHSFTSDNATNMVLAAEMICSYQENSFQGEALTDQDIIEIVQKNYQNCDDEVEVIDQEPVSVSYKQANQAKDQVQIFFETSNLKFLSFDSNECDLELLSKIKERMSDLRLSSLNQTHIDILMTL